MKNNYINETGIPKLYFRNQIPLKSWETEQSFGQNFIENPFRNNRKMITNP